MRRPTRIAAAAVTLAVLTAGAATAGTQTITVGDSSQFAAAVSHLSRSGGTVLLHPGAYRTLVVPPRSGGRLRILGTRGVRVEHLLLDHTRNASVGRLTVAPRASDAWIEVRASRGIDLHDLLVTAKGTRRSASVVIPDSRGVTIRRSTFTHCGDRALAWVNCLVLQKRAGQVTLEDNWFHDCYGCDFIHGRFGSDLTLRWNRFERSLQCASHAFVRVFGKLEPRCGHQDLIEMFEGRRLLVEGNHFGVYQAGGAQLYLANAIDHVRIVNNVFVATDRRVGSYRARLGIYLGGRHRVPHDVRIVNNTILSGALRKNGYEGSIGLAWAYKNVPRRERPIIANNVIALQKTPGQICQGARATIANVIVDGRACSSSDGVGQAKLDGRGRPTAESTLLIDRANRHYAPTRDITGRRRASPAPDVGAYEYVGRR